MLRIILNIAVWMHHFSYKLISKTAIKLEKGIHPKHRIMNYRQFFIDNINSNENVLDIGCGNGKLASSIIKKAKSVTGIDIVKSHVKEAQKRFGKDNIEFIYGDATTFEFEKKYDVVVLSNVLEHIEKRIEFLTSVKNIAPKILIRVPLITRSWLPLYLKEQNMEYRLDKTHFIEYTEEDIFNEINEAGLTIESNIIMWGEIYLVCENKKYLR